MNTKALSLIAGLMLTAMGSAVLAANLPGVGIHDADMDDSRSAGLLQRLGSGESVRLHNLRLEGELSPVTLELERFQVFAPDAKIVVHRGQGKKHLVGPPATAYFSGTIQSDRDSIAVLSVDAQGGIQGIVQQGGRFWMLDRGGAAIGVPPTDLVSRELRQSRLLDKDKPFRCDAETLARPRSRLADAAAGPASVPQALPPGQFYVAPVAIETDGEFYNLFGSTAGATSYIGNLFAYASTLYQRDVGTQLQLGYVSLWSGGPTTDPWAHTSTYGGLTSFRQYWVNNRSGIRRAVAHFLSGRSLGGGIAWLDALCDPSYGYGYSANIAGSFQISNPRAVWDIIVVSHEIGHNFNSPHSHSYQGIGGDANPIDACYNDSTGSRGALPGANSLSGGTAGAGNGTIMSYCHLLSGGYPNIALNFGLNHPYGIKAYRESSLMSNYVAQIAASYPSCISVGGNTQQADLVVTDVVLSPAAPAANTLFSATVTVKNQGAVDAAGGVLGLWANQPTSQVCGASANTTVTLGTLAAGASETYTLDGLSAGMAGTKTLRAFIDKNCATTESVETNNQYTRTYNVASGADFVVTGIVLTPVSPRAGRYFTAAVTVKNQGIGAASGGYLSLWTDQPRAQACRASGNTRQSIGTLGAGTSRTMTFRNVLASRTVGSKTMRAFADSYCQASELDETNNQLTQGYAVAP